MNSIKQRILIDRSNFNKQWLIKKKYYNNNNYLIFSLKWYLVTLIRFLTNKKFDHNLNLISLIISILISLPRSIVVRFIRIIDLFFPPFFGVFFILEFFFDSLLTNFFNIFSIAFIRSTLEI